MSQTARPDPWRLFLLGFLTLFLELVLIRYLAGNVWNLGYFPNLVLLGVFVGMGFGFLLHQYVPEQRSGRLFLGAALALLLLVLFVEVLKPTFPGFGNFGAEIGGEVYFTITPKEGGTGSYLMFGFWFAAVVIIFACISQRTAKLFGRLQPLHAYTLDIAGSVCGILIFMLLSWLQLPAYLWFAMAFPLFSAAMERRSWRARLIPAVPFALIVIVAYGQDTHLMSSPTYRGEMEVRWSPYQKIEYVNSPQSPISKHIFVNGIAHQAMLEPGQIKEEIYQGPHAARLEAGLEPYRRVLIIGAGAGNDVAAALDNGAEHVDAVEIDPVIAELGRRHHPARPYSDPRVNTIVDDGRAFMTRTKSRYDLIVFALTDSLVKVSSMAQLRLENYIFTEDSIRQAYDLLEEGGDLVLYNDYRRGWLIEKYQRMIHSATGKYPVSLYKKLTSVTFLVGRE